MPGNFFDGEFFGGGFFGLNEAQEQAATPLIDFVLPPPYYWRGIIEAYRRMIPVAQIRRQDEADIREILQLCRRTGTLQVRT